MTPVDESEGNTCNWLEIATLHIDCGGGLAQLVATLVRSTELLYAGPG